MMAHMFQITIGQTFSGGFIDFVLFGILQGNEKTNWLMVPVIGIPWFFVYYFSFSFLIKKFQLKTPGREDEESGVVIRNKTERAEAILTGLGGADNLTNIDCCATRLRVSVNDVGQINEDLLKQTGSRGVVKKGNGVQVIYGPDVTIIKNELEEIVGEK
ncbi:PTS transporter subunit EIIB [Bacillus sp. IB182487]|uniref:PTS transporter subunit EIIB n=1 Tax=Metabacillus arenae TaxID=2771434 RepID=A0A926NLA3_9BACI|nr:PTS transporter subunit EIIB [Metabacillus arenae]